MLELVGQNQFVFDSIDEPFAGLSADLNASHACFLLALDAKDSFASDDGVIGC